VDYKQINSTAPLVAQYIIGAAFQSKHSKLAGIKVR